MVRRSDEAIRADPNNVLPASRSEQEPMSEMKALLDEDAPGETADPTREEMELVGRLWQACCYCGTAQYGDAYQLDWEHTHVCLPNVDGRRVAKALLFAHAHPDVLIAYRIQMGIADDEQRQRDERRRDLDEHEMDMDSRWLANDHDVRSHR